MKLRSCSDKRVKKWQQTSGPGFPAAIVAVSAGVAYRNYGTSDYCWINVRTPTIFAFVGPVSVVITANLIFLLVAFRVVLKVHSVHDKSKMEKIKGWLKGSAMLLCLLGVTWILGYLSAISPVSVYYHYIFSIVNSLQGVAIFVCHVLMNDKVRGVIWRHLAGCCLPDDEARLRAANSSSVWSSGSWESSTKLQTPAVSRFIGADGMNLNIFSKNSGASSTAAAPTGTAAPTKKGEKWRMEPRMAPTRDPLTGASSVNPRSPITPLSPDEWSTLKDSHTEENEGHEEDDSDNWKHYQPLSILDKPPIRKGRAAEEEEVSTTELNSYLSSSNEQEIPKEHLCGKDCDNAHDYTKGEEPNKEKTEDDQKQSENGKGDIDSGKRDGNDKEELDFENDIHLTYIRTGRDSKGNISYRHPVFVAKF